ncbi:MAG: histidine kinase [Sphingobacteriales bacterium]|nr:histidine kinase [Sphingobacteriales bacterium]MBI3717018.1 histidine kinase [Sphingobacteriales bacterium]
MLANYLVLLYTGFQWKTAVIDSIVTNSILVAGCLVLATIIRYYLPKNSDYFNLIGIGFVITLIWLFLSRSVLVYVSGMEEYNHFFTKSFPIRFTYGLLMIGFMGLLCVLWYTQQDQKENEKRRIEAEQLTKEAELFKLRQQLQPHFLFNSLNSISALVGTRPDEARKMIQQLSDFLRGTLKREEHQWITLKEELQYLQLYLEIEQVRFGNRLTTKIESDDKTCEMKIPALLLQPLVENAIKFGLYDTTGETLIILHASAVDNVLQITVQNPFDPETSSPKQGTGFGLSSVQRRLYLLFGRNDLVNTKADNNLFITTVKIPQT